MSAPQIIEFADIEIPVKDVIRRMGYPDSKHEGVAQIRTLMDKELIRAKTLFAPKGIYRMLSVQKRTLDTLSFKNTEFVIHSSKVCHMLKDSDPVILFMVTIGPDLEKLVDELFAGGESTQGFILDAIGSETTDAVADKLHWEILADLAKKEGFQVTPRFSPGYGDWPVTVQKEFLKVCGGEQIGISTTPSSLMIPRKSVSAVLGWSKNK
jgi:cobalamin-dependent methionine synthase I